MRLLCAMAAVALAATSMGCQAVRGTSQPSHLTTLASAPRPNIIRTTAFGGGCDSCGDACGCCDTGCCDSGCCGSDCCGSDCCGSGCCGSGDCCDGCCSGNKCINGIVSGLLDCHGPGNCVGGGDAAYNFTPGPPVAQTAYPYYTVRGPRDFLARNPRSIGPTGAYGCQ